MKKLQWLFVLLFVSILVGCGGGGGSTPPSTTPNVSKTIGLGQKGPFVSGSTVKAYKLDTNGSRVLSNSATTTTTDNLGSFSFDSLSWSGPTEIEVSGHYFNEVNGSTSATATLTAVVKVASGSQVSANVNVFTDLEAKRVKALMASDSGIDFDTAKSKAKSEIKELFGLSLPNGVNLEDLDLTKGSGIAAADNAELLRVSAAIAKKPEILSKLENAVVDGNVTNDDNGSAALAELAQEANDLNLTQVAQNLESALGVSDVPDSNDTNTTPPYLSDLHPPIITSNGGMSSADINLNEGSSIVTTVMAMDADGDNITYSLDGADKNKFTINSTTGVLSFVTAPDYENPADANGDNVYTVVIKASDGTLIDTQTLNIHIVNINDNAPQFTNTDSVTVPENQTSAITLSATDVDGDNLTYSISGIDASSFDINSSTGVVTFKNAPDYETTPIYTFTASVSDGVHTVTKDIYIHISNVPDVVPVLQPTSLTVEENATVGSVVGQVSIASSGDSNITSFAIISGGDGKFSIDSNGTVKVANTLDYETQHSYTLHIKATNSAGDSSSVAVVIGLLNVNDNPPVITSNGGSDSVNINVNENSTAVTTVTATDADGNQVTYSLDGADKNKFTINSTTGVLSFVTAPDYDNPGDANGDNSYEVVVVASDGEFNDTQSITVNVQNVPDVVPELAPMNFSVDENATVGSVVGQLNVVNQGDSPITSLTLSDTTNFEFDSSGNLITKVPLDYETTNSYSLTVYATNSAGNSNSVDVNITVNNVNEAPVAPDANFTTPQDTNLTIDGHSSIAVTDPDGDTNITGAPLSSSSVQGGQVIDNGNGFITYVPPTGFVGDDSFDYQVCDNSNVEPKNLCDTGTIFIKVTPVSHYTGAANPGDFAQYTIRGNQLDYNVTGAVFGNKSGTLNLIDVTGSGLFYLAPDGHGDYLKILRSNNLGIAVVPTGSGDTFVVGLQVALDSIDVNKIAGKTYIYAEIDKNNDGTHSIEGALITLNSNGTLSMLRMDGSQDTGCWKVSGNHILAKGDGATDCSSITDTTADVRAVIKPSATTNGRAGFIVDLVDGTGIGIGLEQKAIDINDLNATFEAYEYPLNGTDDPVLVHVVVDNNGTDGNFTGTPYSCDTNGCSLDYSAAESGTIKINQTCDGHSIDGVMCAVRNHNGIPVSYIGFVDKDDGYFIMTSSNSVLIGSKAH